MNKKNNKKKNNWFIGEEREEDNKRAVNYMKQIEIKERKKEEIFLNIMYALRCIFGTPISILTGLLSGICRFIGIITSLGIPVGLYNLYKIIRQWNAGFELSKNQITLTCVFCVFPFLAFALAYLFENISDSLD